VPYRVLDQCCGVSGFINEVWSGDLVKSLVGLLLVLLALFRPVASAADRSSRWRVVWHVSQSLLVAGNTADIATSWGKYETNPLLRTGSRFSYGSMAIKLGMMTGGLTVQYFVARKFPNRIPYFASANLALVGVLGIVAAHNTGVPAAPR
jgi:hypothetical protein